MDVKTPSGTVEKWSFEAGTPNVLFRAGSPRAVAAAGHVVVIDGYRAKDGSPQSQRPQPHVRGWEAAVHGFVRHRRPRIELRSKPGGGK